MPLPNVSSSLFGVGVRRRLRIVSKAVSDFQVIETISDPVIFDTVAMPMTPQRLLIKPEGQRSWDWSLIYTQEDMQTDWIVQDENEKNFRIMTKENWGGGNFFVYDLLECPAPGQV